VKEGRQIAKLQKRIGQIEDKLNTEDGGIEEAEANTLQEKQSESAPSWQASHSL